MMGLTSELTQMGFSYELSRRALSATGGNSLQAALDWILAESVEESSMQSVDTQESVALGEAIMASLQEQARPQTASRRESAFSTDLQAALDASLDEEERRRRESRAVSGPSPISSHLGRTCLLTAS